jgi:hypothetical protein
MRDTLRGQERRDPAGQRAIRFAAHLRRQGFLPSQHFIRRFLQRAQAQGVRFSSRSFGAEFRRASHYRQTRPGYTTRIAVMRGIPVLYRSGGENANRVVLVGLLPAGALPPVTPTRPPQPREGEAMARRTRRNEPDRIIQQLIRGNTALGQAQYDIQIGALPAAVQRLLRAMQALVAARTIAYDARTWAREARIRLQNNNPQGALDAINWAIEATVRAIDARRRALNRPVSA